jgi:hypothetical protein
MLMTPAVVFLPNRVPCGPRRTSTRSRSKLLASCIVLVPMNTPSSITPTAGSKDFSMSLNSMPRMDRAAPWGPAVTGSTTRVGTRPSSCEMFRTSVRSRKA